MICCLIQDPATALVKLYCTECTPDSDVDSRPFMAARLVTNEFITLAKEFTARFYISDMYKPISWNQYPSKEAGVCVNMNGDAEVSLKIVTCELDKMDPSVCFSEYAQRAVNGRVGSAIIEDLKNGTYLEFNPAVKQDQLDVRYCPLHLLTESDFECICVSVLSIRFL